MASQHGVKSDGSGLERQCKTGNMNHQDTNNTRGIKKGTVFLSLGVLGVSWCLGGFETDF
jgi:hypothetical protein